MGRRSNFEKAREALAKSLDPDAWEAPMSREKDLRRLSARDKVALAVARCTAYGLKFPWEKNA